MILVVYLVVVIVTMSKLKKEGKVVSGWTRFIVYSLLVLSLISLLAGTYPGSFTFGLSLIRYFLDGCYTKNFLFRQIGDCIWFDFSITNPIFG